MWEAKTQEEGPQGAGVQALERDRREARARRRRGVEGAINWMYVLGGGGG
jgi:hypothetical protein